MKLIINILISFIILVSVSCSHYENGKYEDLSNNVNKETKDIKEKEKDIKEEEEKKKIEETLKKNVHEVDTKIPQEKGIVADDSGEFED